MYIAIDIIIVAVMLACIIGAAKNGFVVTLFKTLSSVVALLVASIFCTTLGKVFFDSFMYESIFGYVGELVNELLIFDPSALENPELFVASLPDGIRTATELLKIDIAEIMADTAATTASVAAMISEEIATVVSNVLAFAALFFGSLIVLALVRVILNSICKLPVLKKANKVLGFVLGVLEALIIGMVIANIAEMLCGGYGAVDKNFVFTNIFENTIVAKFLISICPW